MIIILSVTIIIKIHTFYYYYYYYYMYYYYKVLMLTSHYYHLSFLEHIQKDSLSPAEKLPHSNL